MPTALDIDVAVDDFGAMLDELTLRPTFVEHDIQRLRQALFQRGGLDRRHAAEIFHANRVMPSSSDDWSEFYLEALVDFFLEYQSDRIVLPADSEQILLNWLGDGVAIDDHNERRLTLRILLKASNIPSLVEKRVLDAVKENLLHQSERWLGVGERSAGIVDVLDMQLIRRLVHGTGERRARQNDQAIVSFLLDLERHAKRFIDQEGWRELWLCLFNEPPSSCTRACTVSASTSLASSNWRPADTDP